MGNQQDSMKVYASRTNRYPSKEDFDFFFDLSDKHLVQSFQVMPIKGENFSTLERKVFIGFYSKKTLPYFAFAYSYGRRGHQQLRDRIMSLFDKSILFLKD